MKNLLMKEFKLAFHPTAFIFLSLSAMLIIPNYPYYVTFFYTTLAIFFTCLSGRENHDIFYTMSLPVRKRDIVKSRFLSVIILELLQVILSVPFAALRQSFNIPGNQVGMDANIAFFGLSFVMLGLFNLSFFEVYYKDVKKVGTAFVISSTVIFVYMLAAETCDHIVPFMKNQLDTQDTEYLPAKLLVLGVGMVIFVILTLISYKRSAKHFEALDL